MTKSRHFFSVFSILLVSSLVYGKSIPVEQRSAARQELNQAAEDTIAMMVGKYPELQEELDNSTGYLAGVFSSGTVLLIGGGSGAGLIYYKLEDSRTYIKLKRVDVGAGLGAGRYRYLLIFHDRSSLLKFRKGTWKPALASESVAGSTDQFAGSRHQRW